MIIIITIIMANVSQMNENYNTNDYPSSAKTREDVRQYQMLNNNLFNRIFHPSLYIDC